MQTDNRFGDQKKLRMTLQELVARVANKEELSDSDRVLFCDTLSQITGYESSKCYREAASFKKDNFIRAVFGVLATKDLDATLDYLDERNGEVANNYFTLYVECLKEKETGKPRKEFIPFAIDAFKYCKDYEDHTTELKGVYEDVAKDGLLALRRKKVFGIVLSSGEPKSNDLTDRYNSLRARQKNLSMSRGGQNV